MKIKPESSLGPIQNTDILFSSCSCPATFIWQKQTDKKYQDIWSQNQTVHF